MLIVDIVGGLGNQMFCYALYRTFLERGRNVFMNTLFYKTRSNTKANSIVTRRKYELSSVFNIKERIAGNFSGNIARLSRKLKLKSVYFDKQEGFQPEILELENGFLSGYWQSFKYSESIQDILRKEFIFKKPLTGKSAAIIDEIRNCNSVSISVRRDDFVRLGWELPEEYYTKAIHYIQKRIPDAKFFCVSDDIDYCKNKWGGGGGDSVYIYRLDTERKSIF